MVMASKQSAKSNKMSDSESDAEQEIVEKKGVSKRKTATAAAAGPSKVTKKAAIKKRGTKAEPVQEKKKEEPKKGPDTEDESDSEESNSDQKVPLLDQPLEMNGVRNRKQVDRFNADLLKEGGRRQYDIEIPEGKGTKLKEIPSILYELERCGADDLKTLHKIMFSRIGNVLCIKDNILMFNGFSFDKNATQYRRTHTGLSKLNVAKLKSISQMLCLPKVGKQADYVERILEFLLKPTDTGKAARESRPERKGAHSKSYKEASADKEGGSSRTKRRGGKAAKSEEEDEEEGDSSDGVGSENGDAVEEEEEEGDGDAAAADLKADEEAADDPPAKKTKRGAAKVVESKKANKKDEKEQDIENGKEDVETEDKKSKKTARARQPKKRTAAVEVEPAKETTGRKQNTANSKKAQDNKVLKNVEEAAEAEEEKVKEEDEEEGADIKEEEPEQIQITPATPEKKTKRPPTDDDIKAFVKTILDEANLEEITMKTVCKQVFEHFPDFDLSNKKEFIKVTVKSFIS